MGKPKTFTSTIYCGNCHNVGAYEFRRGTILHPVESSTWPEHRDFVPGGARKHVIRIGQLSSDAAAVQCKFCKCATALHIRERNGDAPGVALTKNEIAPKEVHDATVAEVPA